MVFLSDSTMLTYLASGYVFMHKKVTYAETCTPEGFHGMRCRCSHITKIICINFKYVYTPYATYLIYNINTIYKCFHIISLILYQQITILYQYLLFIEFICYLIYGTCTIYMNYDTSVSTSTCIVILHRKCFQLVW